ncbi:integrase (plasmid) [Streptomyces uncialis]|uniref:integrase n=1 Tax=Streptomyces uncialis TaxID=1048205 RepID=UPI002E36F2CE|nr:integrase [Streptomyces uncialis]
MTAAVDLDSYVLPLPTPTSPVVSAHLVVPVYAHLNAVYAAPIWPLAPLTANPSSKRPTIHWSTCPARFQDELRLLAWNLINGELRPTFLRERPVRMRGRISAENIRDTVGHWKHLAAWLNDRGVITLGGCSSAVLHDYGQHLLTKHTSRRNVLVILGALTRLWAFDQLSARPAGIERPPWDEFGADDYLLAASAGSSGGENETNPVAEQTMGPLLVWAMRMVDDFADDILAAWAETRRLTRKARRQRSTPAGNKVLNAYIGRLLATGSALPTTERGGKRRLARTYIAAITGASIAQVDRIARREQLAAIAAERPGPCPLEIPVRGRIHGQPWRARLDFAEAATLMRHLGTASFTVAAYLTGMRPQEVLGLRTGCCPAPEPGADGVVGRHLIRANEYKTATDEHGHHQSAGVERDVPWVAITPVVNAIRVLERIVPDGHLLFDHHAHDLRATRPGSGSLTHHTITSRIEDFIAWANTEATAHELSSEIIPPDLHGTIGTGRFRRSLAWHIARRPGGLVALALQYGHLRTALVSEGYASRSRDGIHELIDMETVRAVVDTVADLHDDLESGAGVSGPAARHAIKTAAGAPHFAGTAITALSARRLLDNEDAMLFNNPQALLLCHYKREKALCHRDGVKDTPSLDHCVPGCGNIVRTDRHAALLRFRANTLDVRASASPQPVGDRLRANAARLRAVSDTHDRTRITLLESA